MTRCLLTKGPGIRLGDSGKARRVRAYAPPPACNVAVNHTVAKPRDHPPQGSRSMRPAWLARILHQGPRMMAKAAHIPERKTERRFAGNLGLSVDCGEMGPGDGRDAKARGLEL